MSQAVDCDSFLYCLVYQHKGVKEMRNLNKNFSDVCDWFALREKCPSTEVFLVCIFLYLD